MFKAFLRLLGALTAATTHIDVCDCAWAEGMAIDDGGVAVVVGELA